MLHYHAKKEFDLAYIYGLRAIQTDGKIPSQSSLFIDPSIYLWKVFDIHSLSCWYSGRREEGTAAYKKLLKLIDSGVIPKDQHARLLENKKYFIGNETKKK